MVDQVGELQQSVANEGKNQLACPYFYTTRTGFACRRHFCQVCGPLANPNLSFEPNQFKMLGKFQRELDWITGTTLPDALNRARNASY